jgi:cellulose synthase/poly-beta-1,6-N-acetylglucosamine synthase-like glycosyltransferase
MAGIVYLAIISVYSYGWFRLKSFDSQNYSPTTKVTIIIPARNEEKNILILLNALKQQNYPNGLTEIIVADDGSTDNTSFLVNDFKRQFPELNLLLITIKGDNPAVAYKKKAISKAIESSSGDLIITTDADCLPGKDWLKTMILFYEINKPQMIVGPVSFHNDKSYFEKLQTLEFLSLIAITGGAIRIGKPIMSNGANLAYEKKAFYECGGFGTDTFSSGDDVFLLIKIRNKFGSRSVAFLKNKNAIVYTEAKKNLADFFHQRIRWASKNKGYEFNILIISFAVYLVNLVAISSLILTIIFPEYLKPVIIAFIIKTLIELPILISIVNFVGRQTLLIYAFPLIIIYPLYIILTGVLGVVAGYQWKGRKVKQ